MFDDLIIDHTITPTEITANETLYDFYRDEAPKCEDCGGFTFGINNECYFGEGVN